MISITKVTTEYALFATVPEHDGEVREMADWEERLKSGWETVCEKYAKKRGVKLTEVDVLISCEDFIEDDERIEMCEGCYHISVNDDGWCYVTYCPNFDEVPPEEREDVFPWWRTP